MDIDHLIPSASFAISKGPGMIIYIALVAALASFLKVKKGLKTAYTRKIFHFLIFTAAAVIQFMYGLKGTVLFGSLVVLLILFAVWQGNKNSVYRALARESDYPHAKRFILIPLFSTAVGGLLSNLVFPAFAFVGYLVGGWGDAIGEPVGARWGKHKYQVPTLFGVKAQRSIEGSFAVFLVSALICFASYLLLSFSTPMALKYALICAAAATLTEALSSHGTDNLTIQFVAAGVSYYLLS